MIRDTMILYGVSPVYVAMLMSRQQEMTVIRTYTTITDNNQSRLQALLCENIKNEKLQNIPLIQVTG